MFLSIIGFLGFNQLINAQEAAGIDTGISESVNNFSEIITPGTKIVVLNMQSESATLSEYIIDEIIKYFLQKRNYTIVDRQNLELIQQEMDFQLSGEVSDVSAQSIGKKLGAEIIISGSIDPFGSNYRLRLRAIDVETAAIHGIETRTILTDDTMAVLLGQPAASTSTAKRITKQREAKPAPVLQQNDSWFSMGGGLKGGLLFRTMEVEYELGDYSFDQTGYNIGGGMFLDLIYALVSVDFMYAQLSGTTGYWIDGRTSLDNRDVNFHEDSQWGNGFGILNIGLFGKYPFKFSKITLFPLAGVEYGFALISGQFESSKHSALWLRVGAGMDYALNPTTYFRINGSYGFKFNSEYEKTNDDLREWDGQYNDNFLGEYSYETHGISINLGIGFKL